MAVEAQVDERTEALEKLASIAALGGINMGTNEQLFRLEGGFELPNGRYQVCYARPSGMAGGKMVVTVFSPCMQVKKGGLFGGVTKDMAVDLLRRNENVLFARYGLADAGDAEVVVASADYLLDTLDPEEFEAAIWHVAMAADAFESHATGGKDQF